MKVRVGLNLILNSCFDIDYFGYVIDCICFVRNLVNFFGMVIVLYNLYYRVIVVQSNWSYLEVVFLNYYYYECFCWVNFHLPSCIDEMIFLVDFQNFSDFLDKSVSESLLLFICEVVVWMLFRCCKFSVSSSFKVISACSIYLIVS